MIGARGRERTCQEASSLSSRFFIPCDSPAVAIVDNGDEHPYFMCGPCAEHNVENWGAIRWFTVERDLPVPYRHRCCGGTVSGIHRNGCVPGSDTDVPSGDGGTGA